MVALREDFKCNLVGLPNTIPIAVSFSACSANVDVRLFFFFVVGFVAWWSRWFSPSRAPVLRRRITFGRITFGRNFVIFPVVFPPWGPPWVTTSGRGGSRVRTDGRGAILTLRRSGGRHDGLYRRALVRRRASVLRRQGTFSLIERVRIYGN